MNTKNKHPRLGVNIDHIATLREARRVSYPKPVEALEILKECHVDQVTIHLREDRRHIKDDDLNQIIEARVLPVNLEMAVIDEMIQIASGQKPQTVTFVPEKRQEITTEGGLDCVQGLKKITSAINILHKKDIRCSLFIDPDLKQVRASKNAGAQGVEFHTGTYCNIIEDFYKEKGHYNYACDADWNQRVQNEILQIRSSCDLAQSLGLQSFAGHGLHKDNLRPVTFIKEIEEYNIGHAIIARSVFVGLKQAINEISAILNHNQGS